MEEDWTRAESFWKKACDLKESQACAHLADRRAEERARQSAR